MKISPLTKGHYMEVAAIYAEGLQTSVASFETTAPNWEEWNEKFLPYCRYVVHSENKVAAWCALSAVSKREVYKGVAEDTIYVKASFQNKGIGKTLLTQLMLESEKAEIWTLQASIFSQNEPSIRLHESCGFRIVGTREKIAQRDGQWHDNVLMEYRSKKYLDEKHISPMHRK